MRDPASLNKPSTREIGAANMIGTIPGTDVHWGLVFGLIAALAAYILIYHTVVRLRRARRRRQRPRREDRRPLASAS